MRAFSDATLMRRLLDALPAMISYWDGDRRNVLTNTAYGEWYGLAPEEMTGKHLREVIGEQAYAQDRPYIAAALRGEPQILERTILDAHDHSRPSRIAYVPDLAAGEVRGVIVLVTDLTASADAQRTPAEQEVARLNTELDRANTLQADVIAMLGHEARQPLALVRLLIESMLAAWDDLSDDVKQSDLLRATRAAYDLGHLLDDVLAMTYVESGRAVGNAAPTRVLEAVDRCLALVPGGVVVEVNVDEAITVLAEPWQLRQMIGNLIGNAAKYGAPPVAVSAQTVGDRVEISVSDCGPGVAEAFVPHLFERFTRVQHPAERGTGFGLYIVRRLAETNNGSAGYRRNEPTGAVFTITLPAARTTAD
jgi:PAS domain S-box-containing protein